MCDAFTHGGHKHERTANLCLSLRSERSTTTLVCERTSLNKTSGYVKVISSNLPPRPCCPGAEPPVGQSGNQLCSILCLGPISPPYPFHCVFFLISLSLAPRPLFAVPDLLCFHNNHLKIKKTHVIQHAHVYVKHSLLLECLCPVRRNQLLNLNMIYFWVCS